MRIESIDGLVTSFVIDLRSKRNNSLVSGLLGVVLFLGIYVQRKVRKLFDVTVADALLGMGGL